MGLEFGDLFKAQYQNSGASLIMFNKYTTVVRRKATSSLS